MRSEQFKEVADPLAEARRYVDNAKQTLIQNGQLNTESRRYEDPKYVKAAGNYLWLAVLTALDAVFQVKKSNKKGDRVNVKIYKEAVSKRDSKLLAWVNYAYDVMHISMNYDGIQNKVICDEGYQLANEIIDRCSTLLPGAKNNIK